MKSSQSTLPIVRFLPVLLLLAFIAAESTRHAGEAQTRTALFAILGRLHVLHYFADAGKTNKELRKIGHLFGYGLLGVAAAQLWTGAFLRRTGRTWLQAARLALLPAVLCSALVGALDEWHQSFLPGRTSSAVDVLIDTLGATVFGALYLWIGWAKRHRTPAA